MPSRLSVGEVADPLFALSHDLLCEVGVDGHFKRLNPSFERTLGWTDAELLARPLVDLVHPDDCAATLAAMAKLGTDAVPELLENRYRCRDGSYRWLSWRATAPDARGLFYAVARDITAQKAAEAALRESEERFRGLVEAAHEGVWALDAVGRTTYVNPRMAELLGYPAGELVGRPLFDFMDPAAAFEARTRFARRQRGIAESHPLVFRRGDGAALHTIVTVSSLRDAAGAFVGALALVTDVTERRRAEEALRASERFSDILLDASLDCVKLLDLDGRLEQVNAPGRALMEVEHPTALRGLVWASLWPEDGARQAAEAVATARAGGVGRVSGYCPTRRGTPKWWDVTVTPVRDGAGRVVRLLAVSRDVTEARHAEEGLRESEALLRGAFEQAPIGMALADPQGRWLRVNRALCDILGYTEAELLATAFPAITHPDDLAVSLRHVDELVAGERASYQLEKRYVHRRGHDVWVSLSVGVVRDEEGRPRFLLAQVQDITERKRAETALLESEERFRLATRATSDIVYDWDIPRDELFLGETLTSLFGYAPEQVGRRLRWWTGRIHPEDVARVQAGLDDALRGDGTSWRAEYRFCRADGTYATVLDRGFLLRDDAGRPSRFVGSMTDLTERERLQAQLRQAQRMEAVGRLAGGVAHDFNNLIQVITAATLFARDAIPADSPARDDLADIDEAARRAAGLTRQLLAFSRQQVLRPEQLNLNRVVSAVEKMLRRVIGADITLVTDLQPELDLVHADAGQLEQVLMNLAVNARDAMPDGGTLALETENVQVDARAAADRPGLQPGSYVALRVRDTGTGMDEATRVRVFEPFFTTKEAGRGTGLGLSTVYGIVKQSGGYVYVDSAPGAGSTFLLLLPVARAAGDEAAEARAARALLRGSETVLLVEDEAGVRAAVRRMLERAGYAVLEARHGADALAILEAEGDRVALVLTDVVMPEMGASGLMDRMRARRLRKRTLLISGYSAEAVARQGPPVDGVALLTKPFTPEELLRRVREVLDAPPPA